MWIEPKIDWQDGDPFNIEDYNRIKNNLNEIRQQALVLWPDFEYDEMGEDKTYEDYGFYADELNLFEKNVTHICEGTYPFAVGTEKSFAENQPFIDAMELNRLESACLIMYGNIRGRIEGRKHLPFTLNGGDF